MFNILVNLFFVFLLLKHSFCHLCDLCSCDQSDAVEVRCDCHVNKYLHFTSSLMTHYKSVKKLQIVNCQVLSVERNSFLSLNELEYLKIEDCQHLYLSIGSFTKLNLLYISNISDISLGNMAFMGSRNIKQIVIKSANINNVNSYAFYDIENLDNFYLSAVNIDVIHKNAINLSSNLITIENSKIDEISSESISLRGEKTNIKKTIFKTTHSDSITINSIELRIADNYFKGDFNFNIRSTQVEFSRNHFRDILTDGLQNAKHIIFFNNFVYETNFKQMFAPISHGDFHDNIFPCNCNASLLNHTKDPKYFVALKNNFCKLDCYVSLLDFELKSMIFCGNNRLQSVQCEMFSNTSKIANKRESIKSFENLAPTVNCCHEIYSSTLILILIFLLNYSYIT